MRILGVLGLVVLAAGPALVGCGGTAARAHGDDVVLHKRAPAALTEQSRPARAEGGQSAEAPSWKASAPTASAPATESAPGPVATPSEPVDEPALAAGVTAASRASAGMGNKAPAADTPKLEERGDRKVQVAGIEGTLANFDVRVTMEAKAREFGACHAPRLRKVPGLSGNVEFKIRVLADGSVSSVELPSSDLGDRALERCFAGVIKATQFPKPRGGDANVTYSMQLSPSRPSREPEQWEPERIRHVLQKRADDVRDMCELRAPRAYRTTIYVNRRGKVVAAGVAGKADADGAYDCIADAVRKWPMPKAKKKALAKVTFAMVGTT